MRFTLDYIRVLLLFLGGGVLVFCFVLARQQAGLNLVQSFTSQVPTGTPNPSPTPTPYLYSPENTLDQYFKNVYLEILRRAGNNPPKQSLS